MLGEKIKNLRERNGYSQERLAEQLGVSRQAVSKWETGLSRPDMGNLIALAKLFHISFDELIGNEKVDLPTEPVAREQSQTEHKQRKKSRIFFIAGCLLILLICGYLYFFYFDTKDIGNPGTVNPDSGDSVIGGPKLSESDATSAELDGLDGLETEALQETPVDKPQDSLNAVESVQFQTIVQNFANAYFRSDPEEAAQYSVIGEDEIEVYPEDIFDDLAYMVLKWNPQDLFDQSPVCVQYQWQRKGSDSADYLGLEVMKINEEWKVTNCYLEK